MRRLPKSLAILLVAIALPTAAMADRFQSFVERSDRTIPATGLRAIDVTNARGSVNVQPSPDGQLHVVAIKTIRVHGRPAASKYSAQTKVLAHAEGERWVMRVEYPKRIESQISFWDLFGEHNSNGSFLPGVEVRLELQVPAGFRSRIETVSGDIDLQGLSGPQSLRTTSGDVNLRDVTGATDVSVVSGDVDLLRVKSATLSGSSGDVSASGSGVLRVNTISGDVEIGDATDSLIVRTVSGDVTITGALRGAQVGTTSGTVEVSEIAGGVRLSSQSGDLQASLIAPLKPSEMQSTSGEIELALPASADAALEAHSTSGSIDCQAAVRLLSHDRNSLSARLGRGGVPVVLRSTSGDITVTSGGK